MSLCNVFLNFFTFFNLFFLLFVCFYIIFALTLFFLNIHREKDGTTAERQTI